MIDAYLDESGIHDGAAICVIAGYFGGRGQWNKFEKHWKQTFIDGGMLMEEFHAKTLLKKEDPKFKKIARSLVTVIAEFAPKIHPVSAAIIVKDFYSFSFDDRRFMTGATWKNDELIGTGSPDKPYYIPFQHCLTRIARRAPVGGKARFFFGLDRTFSGYAEALYKQAKADPFAPFREELGDIAFPPAKATAQLQAADLLVHLSYQYALEMMKNNSWGKVQPQGLLMDALAGTVDQGDHTFQDRQCLKETLTKGIPDFYKRIQGLSAPAS
jgi:hypothetical protein